MRCLGDGGARWLFGQCNCDGLRACCYTGDCGGFFDLDPNPCALGRLEERLLTGLGMGTIGEAKIRRDAVLPRVAEEELRRGKRYPYEQKIPVRWLDCDVVMRFRRSGWELLGDEEEERVGRREVVAWLMAREERIGFLRFVDYRPPALIGNDEFFRSMDAERHSDSEVAQVLCAAWENIFLVSDYGSILLFDIAWVVPSAAGIGLLRIAADALMGRLKSQFSIMIMKAFPLEYEGTGRATSAIPFIRRQRAMFRHYHRLWGVKPFPGRSGDNGWLWRAFPRVAERIPRPDSGNDDLSKHV